MDVVDRIDVFVCFEFVGLFVFFVFKFNGEVVVYLKNGDFECGVFDIVGDVYVLESLNVRSDGFIDG